MEKGHEHPPATQATPAPPYPGPPMGVYQAQPGIQPGKTKGTFISAILPASLLLLSFQSVSWERHCSLLIILYFKPFSS